MAATEGLFELSKEAVAELAIVAGETGAGVSIAYSGGELFEIISNAEPDEQRDPANYTVFICQTAHVGEQETRHLIDDKSETTAGYVFPVTAYRDSDNFDGKWLRRYADIGFRYATNLSVLSEFSASVSIETLRGRKLCLDSVFDDRLSIVVLGNSNIASMDADADTLELMLFREGINIVRSRHEILPAPSPSEWSKNVNLQSPGALVTGEAAVFLGLMRNADRDQLGIGAFMHLYQTLEFCIDHIFGWSVEKIANAQLDTWEMKNQLSQITGEPYRLALLDTNHLSRMTTRECLHDLADECRTFLAALQVDFDEKWSWHKLLYKCRNIVVHNQIMMMKAPSAPLRGLVEVLRSASFDILFCFGPSLETNHEMAVATSDARP